MNLRELQKIVNDTCAHLRDWELDAIEVMIPIRGYHVGGTHSTKVKSAGKGCDWDKHKFMLFPEENLQEVPDNISDDKYNK